MAQHFNATDDNEFARYLASYISNDPCFSFYELSEKDLEECIKDFMETLP